mgnify:CR=1 FL=1
MNRKEFIVKSTAFAAGSAFLPACAKDNSEKGNVSMKVKVKKDRVLVVYFSRSGNTRHAAETFAKACGGARLVEIKAAKPYASDYGACCDEAKPECRAGTLRPIEKIAALDVSAYDVVLVGTPNWWGTLAPPVRTWVSENAATLKAKTVCLFQTHGGGGMQNCARDFAALVEGATVLPAESYYGATVKVRPGLKSFVAERIELM